MQKGNQKINTWPYYDQEQIEAVTKVLRSSKVNSWTGDEVKSFENEFSSKIGINHSIAIANGSLALSSCYLASDLHAGDEVITTPRTFIATSSSLMLLKIKPIFADVDVDSGCITADTIEPLINKKTKAIVVVHLGGWPAEMEKITKLASNYNLKLIEDCAQAHGAKIKGKSVGTFGDMAAWSFCTDKIMSTGGEGGMVTTNNNLLWESVWSLKDHGKSYNAVFKRNHRPGFKWLHEGFGSNFRLTEMQAAIGRIQLNKLDEWNSIRSMNAMILINELNKLSILNIPLPPNSVTHAWYKFHCYLNMNCISSEWSRDRIVNEINSLGYPAFHGSCSEIYMEKCFKDKRLVPKERLANAKKLGETSLMFLLHPTITKVQMKEYANTIRKVLEKATK